MEFAGTVKSHWGFGLVARQFPDNRLGHHKDESGVGELTDTRELSLHQSSLCLNGLYGAAVWIVHDEVVDECTRLTWCFSQDAAAALDKLPWVSRASKQECGRAPRDVDTLVEAADRDKRVDVSDPEVVQDGASRAQAFTRSKL
jgi:hypothetical protein